MPVGRALALLLLLLPAAARGEAAREPSDAGLGLSAELTFDMIQLEDPQGSAFRYANGFGARLGLRLPSGTLGLPEALELQPELAWAHTSFEDGTKSVRVGTAFDFFALPLRLGYRFEGGPRLPVYLTPYLCAGPAITLVGIDYRIADPVVLARGGAPEQQSQGGSLLGAAYGAGAAYGLRLGGGAALIGRLEALRIRRWYSDDLILSLGLGAAL